MLKSTFILTLGTVLGLALGFFRDILLVKSWGIGGLTDAFLVAIFVPEMIRMMLGGGLLSAAAIPLWHETSSELKPSWSVTQTWHTLLAGIGLAVLLMLAGPVFIWIVGPGLSTADHDLAGKALLVVAWCIPGFFIQAFLSVFLQASHRYFWSSLGSLLFNLPPVAYLALNSHSATIEGVAQAFVVGSFLMWIVLIPQAYGCGWRWRGSPFDLAMIRAMYVRLWPLLMSSLWSHGVVLVERAVASSLGPGAITLMNLARKFIGVPMIGLKSLSQIALSKMSQSPETRVDVFYRVLRWSSIPSIAATVFFVFGARPVVEMFLPHSVKIDELAVLLSVASLGLLFNSWNALLARYYYAASDTRTPYRVELAGSVFNVVALLAFPLYMGVPGLSAAGVAGSVLTTVLFIRRTKGQLHLTGMLGILGMLTVAFFGVWAALMFYGNLGANTELIIAIILSLIATMASLILL